MLRAQLLLIDLQGSPVEWLRLGIFALVRIEQGQVIDALSCMEYSEQISVLSW